MTEATICELIKIQSDRQPDSPAILAPERLPLNFKGLLDQIHYVIKSLNGSGIKQADRVAVVLPNGPEMAVTFLAVASTATCAPLNPAYLLPEYEFYLADLNAKAMITVAGTNPDAIKAAQAANIIILELEINPQDPAGKFEFKERDSDQTAIDPSYSQSHDVALVQHTSGTTSRPKIVPLTHSNLCTSAFNIIKSYGLNPDDKCLNVMPLFHIHGLVGATISTLVSGGSIVCTPGFSSTRFFPWLEEFSPTWYTAVPTMQQAVLSEAEYNPEIISQNRLRFIRTCSTSLPPVVMERLESVFGVPVLEAYGMTEAAHQMSSNPLPPMERKAGSVGVKTGVDIAIMDELGNLLGPEMVGEIVIKGGNVTSGYENNPTANQNSFLKGWFRTGDQGYMDKEGYLFITGRLKEIINRGGEKIAPREVDEVLLEHPSIRQAVTFALPHPTLGEDIAAAVVLRENQVILENELREFAGTRLVDFKVPSRILILDDVPKGPTGKLQRIGLAEKLSHLLEVEYVQPRNPVEQSLVKIWSELLNLDQVGVKNDFSRSRGDSLLAAILLNRVKEDFGVDPSLEEFYKRTTIAEQALFLDALLEK